MVGDSVGSSLADSFCEVITRNPQMTNATARIGAWLIGAAYKTGGFPIELSFRQIGNGFTRNGVTVEGTGSHATTIRQALEWLEENGHLKSTDGNAVGFGHRSRIYTM